MDPNRNFLAHCSGCSLQSFVTYFSINYYKLKYLNTKKKQAGKKNLFSLIVQIVFVLFRSIWKGDFSIFHH